MNGVAEESRRCGVDLCWRGVHGKYAKYCQIHQIAKRGKDPKYAPNERIDATIREAYRLFWEYGNRKAIKGCAARIGWPDWAVKKRAQAIGLSKTTDSKPWTPEEEELLRKYGYNSDIVIARKLGAAGFHRTPTAVHLKMKRERIRATLDGYSARQLAEAFGVDDHKITFWIHRGLLKATRREQERTPQQGGNAYWIRHADVRDFVMRCPDEVDLKKVEKFWFLDLVTGGKLCRTGKAA